jgi:hypothetical protein
MKRFNFAWGLVAFMAVMAVLIFVNRFHRFFEPRSWVGYTIYVLFLLAGLLVIVGAVLTILSYYKNKNRAPN